MLIRREWIAIESQYASLLNQWQPVNPHRLDGTFFVNFPECIFEKFNCELREMELSALKLQRNPLL